MRCAQTQMRVEHAGGDVMWVEWYVVDIQHHVVRFLLVLHLEIKANYVGVRPTPADDGSESSLHTGCITLKVVEGGRPFSLAA
ncbi:hypothetical protein Y032_0291g1564 [Ancylostoma ceylanicum]|uniref:Uncharacterized protein n=1 Tax=Ancylostoma ceylanicum TaxID=53326 RepID=A0A016S5K6_9BILA|nr:hypothetical protein Y032_0291g1564 [Ancylostoma ceylanicum]